MEEAPSPALDERLRKKMAAAAVSLAKQAGYQSLGTVEFLLDHQKHFYFMEMNTRIQVEHPVTEEITGIDLVELQFNIAAGRKLPLRQSQIHLNGWSIECRINAEDVQAGFSPSIGVIRQLRLPQGNHIRIETGIAPGYPFFRFYGSQTDRHRRHPRTSHRTDSFGTRTFPCERDPYHNPFLQSSITQRNLP